MSDVGLLLSDVPRDVDPARQFRDVLAIVAAAQEHGFTHLAVGQHFLYGDLRWLQPIPLLARLAAEVEPSVRLVTQIVVAPLYHPVLLAEEVATLDIVTEGRLVFGAGLGYRAEEFGYLDVPFAERASRMDEGLELMRALWTQDRVDFHGRHWQLEDVQPHLRPVQQPHPPIWIGAHALAGVRRAGRLGDAYVVPPETTLPQIVERFGVLREGFDLRGKAFGPQPVRRNVMIGSSREHAVSEYARVAKGRYVTYAERGLDVLAGRDLEAAFEDAVADHAVVGTVDEVVEELVGLVRRLPVDPLLLRPQWPSMSLAETLETIAVLGSTVVPAVREVEPRSDIHPDLLRLTEETS